MIAEPDYREGLAQAVAEVNPPMGSRRVERVALGDGLLGSVPAVLCSPPRLPVRQGHSFGPDQTWTKVEVGAMSAMGHKRTLERGSGMSASPLGADMLSMGTDVR